MNQEINRRMFFRILQLRTLKITVSVLTYVIFLGPFWNVVRTFIALWSRTRFCMIKYVHNGPFNEAINFGIVGLIFQVKFTKFGTNVGLNM